MWLELPNLLFLRNNIYPNTIYCTKESIKFIDIVPPIISIATYKCFACEKTVRYRLTSLNYQISEKPSLTQLNLT